MGEVGACAPFLYKNGRLLYNESGILQVNLFWSFVNSRHTYVPLVVRDLTLLHAHKYHTHSTYKYNNLLTFLFNAVVENYLVFWKNVNYSKVVYQVQILNICLSSSQKKKIQFFLHAIRAYALYHR